MPVLDEEERATLRAADVEMGDLQRALEMAAATNALDDETFRRLFETLTEVVHRFNQNLPPQLDADARDEIRRRLIEMLTLRSEGLSLLDIADRALLEAEAVRHVVRDVLDDQPPVELRDAAAVLRLLEETWVPDLTVRQLSELLGMPERTLQRRRQDGGPSTPRMQLVAKLVAILRHGWTDAGVYAWFLRPRSNLEERPPVELLDSPDRERALLNEARSGRVQGGS